MPFCRHCGSSMNATDRFCPDCGDEQGVESNTCPSCRAPQKPGDQFCDQCGHSLSAPAQAPAPPRTPPPPIAAAVPLPPPRPPRKGPNVFWPTSIFGNLFYLVALAGAGWLAYMLAEAIKMEEPELGLHGKEPLLIGAFVAAGYVVLTIFRAIGAAIFPGGSTPSAPDQSSGGGGGATSVIGIIVMLLAVGTVRKCTKDYARKKQSERRFENLYNKNSDRNNPGFRNDGSSGRSR